MPSDPSGPRPHCARKWPLSTRQDEIGEDPFPSGGPGRESPVPGGQGFEGLTRIPGGRFRGVVPFVGWSVYLGFPGCPPGPPDAIAPANCRPMPPWNGGFRSRATEGKVLPVLGGVLTRPLAGAVGPGAGGDTRESLAKRCLDRTGPPPAPCAPGKGACQALEALPPGNGEGTQAPLQAARALSGETHFVWGPGELRTRSLRRLEDVKKAALPRGNNPGTASGAGRGLKRDPFLRVGGPGNGVPRSRGQASRA